MQGCFLFLIGWCIKEYWLIDAQCQDASRSSVKRHHEMQWRKAAAKSLVRTMVTIVISRLWCRRWCGLQWVEGGVWYWWSVGGETGFSAAAKVPLECTLIFLRWIHLFRGNLIWSKIYFRCTVIALQRVVYFQLLKRNTKTTNNEINVFALTVACRLAACSKRPMFSKCPGFVAFWSFHIAGY